MSLLDDQISPSKARRDALNNHAWSITNDWLNKLFAPQTVPIFERNAETLAALQSLMRANIAADERRKLIVESVREEVLWNESQNGTTQAAALMEDLEVGVDDEGRAALDSLATAAVHLGVGLDEKSRVSLDDFGSRIQVLTVEAGMLIQQIDDLKMLRKGVDAARLRTEETVRDLESKRESEQAIAESLQAQTARWTREAKQVSIKIEEYRERVAGLERLMGRVQDTESEELTFEAVRHMEKQLEGRKNHMNMLENDLKEFHGLPPDLEASRAEVRRAQFELDDLQKKRNDLFQAMTEL